MKKIFTTLFAVLGIYTMAHAQTKNQNEFGFNLGINSTYVSSSAQLGTATGLLWGFTAAVSAEHYLSNDWGIKAKVIYDSKGWSDGYIQDNTKTVTGVSYSLNYITIPITANYHFGHDKNWYANAGPYVGFLLNATDNYNNSDLKSKFNSTDAGLDLGLGIKFPVTKSLKAFFEYDGQLGFANVLANSSPGAVMEKASFSVGLKF